MRDAPSGADDAPLGLPAVAIRANNPRSVEKKALGKKQFSDQRWSAFDTVSHFSCYVPKKGRHMCGKNLLLLQIATFN
jgi:cytochrome c peroxidase